ncbi:unnamed protein product [Mytilus edulis]|uniref:Uncharacterized protein n=1 Tax=Mytilus edulis TaxID=6550 RepID=A0A8S3THL2_MYTED|nr:unnamed protein product [Mytilus edulis]
MNCSLSCFDTSVCCSSSFESLCDIDKETSDKVLSEVGLLFCQRTKNFSVCNVHLEEILVKNRSKNKSVRCAIPTLLSRHKKTAPRAERNITKDAMMKIHSSTGIVLAIGTPALDLSVSLLLGKSLETEIAGSLLGLSVSLLLGKSLETEIAGSLLGLSVSLLLLH